MQPCVVRNAHGVIHDVNENFVHSASSRPRRRYHYTYALFSASGFSEPAQAFALAQQISLIDISGASFEWLRNPFEDAAAQLYEQRNQHRVRRFPVSWMRHALRVSLDTALSDSAEPALDPWTSTNAPRYKKAAQEILDEFTAALRGRENAELLLGFPAAPFILTFGVAQLEQFVDYAERHPSHAVRLRRTGANGQPEWTASPSTDPSAYQLTFNLPEQVESWISENEDQAHQLCQGRLPVSSDALPPPR
jgi:hypothetical protein